MNKLPLLYPKRLCKQGKKLSALLLILLLVCCSSVTVYAALSGTYTIDPSQSASGNNYKSFAAAVADMMTGDRNGTDLGSPNGTGISSHVTFLVAPGVYIEQVNIGAITGVSASSTITFIGTGTDASSTVITYSGATSLATAFTVKIASPFVSFRNLTIEAGHASYGWPLHISNTSNVKVKNCIITFAPNSLYTNHTNTNYCAVVVNGGSTTPTTGSSVRNIEIDSNIIRKGYGNYLTSGNGANDSAIYFRNNIVDSTNFYGVYVSAVTQFNVSNNNIRMIEASNLGVGGSGIYITGSAAAAGKQHIIAGNKVLNSGANGIYLTNSSGQTALRSLMYNNSIGGGFKNTSTTYGICFQNSTPCWDVFHNSVNLDVVTGAGTSSAAFYNATTSYYNSVNNLDVRNNIFAVTAPGSPAYTVYFPNGFLYAVSNATTACNYNIYYKEGAGNNDPIFYNGGNLLNKTNLIGNSSYNTNSLVINPAFTGRRDLMPLNPCNNAVAIGGITKDINGTTRSATPDIGAYEPAAQSDDIGIESIVSPVLPFISGLQDIKVVLKNYGSTTITSASVSYLINGTFPITYYYTGSLAPCATTTITFSGANQFNFAPNTAYDIKVYSESPNGVQDLFNLNDTARIPMIFSALSGNYTIDNTNPASATNFVSFTDAVNALTYGGVNGPVYFNVLGSSSNPYNEQVSINTIPGLSASNTITFDGGAGNAANRILSFNTSTAQPYVFRTQVPYITLRNLTIRSIGSSMGWPVHILGNTASNVKVVSCLINYTGGNGANSAGSTNFIGIVVNNSATSASGGTTSASNIDLDSNVITGGDASIYIYGGGANFYNIRNNTMTDPNQNGVYVFLIYQLRVNNNVVNMRQTGSASSVGLSLNNCYNQGTVPHEIQNNVIMHSGQYGMYLYYYNGLQGSNRAKVINNIVGGNFRSADPAGVYLTQNAMNVDFWFNTISLGNVASATQSAAFKALSTVGGLDVRNNTFAVMAPTSTSYPLFAEFAENFNVLDYNNYYTPNANRIMNVASTTYHVGNFKGANQLNTKSVSVNPGFVSTTDLRTTLLCNHGIAIPSVTTDFEGNTRGIVPDIGADESNNAVSNDLMVVELLNPSLPLATGDQNLRVVIKNNGNTTITNADIAYSVNGGTPVVQSWGGALNPCDSTIIEFNASSGPVGAPDQRFRVVPGLSYSFKVYSSLPNFTPDGNTVNDTLVLGPLCPALAGQYYIDSMATVPGIDTFMNFTAAANALNCGGISGPVTFTVLKGTYDEQFTLNDIVGSSTVNRIVFDGGAGNDSTRIVTFGGQTNTTRHTMMLNNTKNIAFRNLTFRGKGTTYGWPVHIFGTTTNVSIKHCVVDFENNGTVGNSTNFISVVVNGSTTTPTTTAAFTNIEIDDNKIAGGFSNVYFSGNGTNTGISFKRNTLYNADNFGLYVNNVIGPKVIANTVNMRIGSTTSVGINFGTVITNATANAEIIRNRVYDAGQVGISVSAGTATGLRPRMVNNSVGGLFRNTSSINGISIANTQNWDVIYNSVIIDTPAAATANTSGALYINGSTQMQVKNNNLLVNYMSSGANVLALRSTTSTTYIAGGLDYNNYYIGGNPTDLISVNGTSYGSTGFTTGGGANSLNNFSGFISGTGKDLIPLVANNNGVTISSITNTDINDSTRNTPPDMGAFEIPSGLYDLGIIETLSPDPSLPGGSRQVSVTVKNFGSTSVTSFNLRHTVNGANLQDSAFSGILINPNEKLTVTLDPSKNAQIPNGVSTVYQVYLHNPNGFLDDNQFNDTITLGPKVPALSGIYTINPAGSGASNFVSFTTAVNALNAGGVGGPVTFQVAPTTYVEQVNLGAITGVSATNTISFEGGAGNAATTIVEYANTAASFWTVRLNNSPNVTFRNLTIRAKGTTDGVAVQISGTSDNSKIKNCILEITGNGATATTPNYGGVLISNTASAATPNSGTGMRISNLEIDSNTFNAGNYAIYAYSITGTPYTTQNKYRGNTINNTYTYGAYFYYNEAITFTDNKINLRPTTIQSYGLYLDNCQNTSTNRHIISANDFRIVNRYGIYVNGGNAVARNQMTNNMIKGFNGTSSYGIYLTNTYNYDVYHNTVYVDTNVNSNQYASLFIQGGSNFDVRNNIFVANQTGSGFPVYISSLPNGYFILNYNNMYKFGGNATTGLLYLNNVTYSAANLYSNPGYNQNSISENPVFVSNSNLHLKNPCSSRGMILPSVTRDIDGQLRSTPSHLGADEATGTATDVAADLIIPFVSGLQDVKVRIKNYGSTPLTSATVAYTVNGGTPKVVNWTGVLNPCDTVSVVFTGVNQYNFALGSSYSLQAYTSQPNGITDPNTSNDTITIASSCVSLAGNFTINPAGSGPTNFTSIRAAVAALSCGGVIAPVTFTLAPGTYNEQVNMLAPITGASNINRVTFDGVNAANVIIDTAANTTTNFWTVRLQNVQYVTFRNLTIQASGASNGTAVFVMGGSHNNAFKKCNISIVGAGATSTGSAFNAMVISNATTSTSLSTNGYVNNIEVDSNTITGGYYGIYAYGTTNSPYSLNNKFRYNNIVNSYQYGLYFYYHEGLTITNNTINIRTSTAGSYGMRMDQCYNSGTNKHTISYNNLTNVNRYGIYLQNISGSVQSAVVNNMITGFNGASSYGIYMASASSMNIYHNTVHVNTTSGGGSSLYISSGSNIDVRNNIFSALGLSNTAAYIINNPGTFTFNYNNYYKFNAAGSSLIYLNTTNYTTADFAGAGGFNTNSVSILPNYVNATNVHLTSACSGRAPQLPSVTDDIDGQSRGASPLMGADEMSVPSNDVGVQEIKAFSAGLQDVKVVIKNYGSNAVTSVNVAYSINGGLARITQWTGTLNPCDTVTVVFTGGNQFNFQSGVSYIIEAYTAYPNLILDSKFSNDTLRVGPTCISLTGNYTINATGSGSNNFASFTDAVNALKCGGVSGPVVFTVAPNTYSEYFSFNNAISGASATNTVTFVGGGVANTSITAGVQNTEVAYTIKLENVSYLTFRDIKIVNTGASYGCPLIISNSATNIRFTRCHFEVPASSFNQGSFPVLVSATTNVQSPYTNVSGVSNIAFDSCRLLGGYANTWIYGGTNSPSNISFTNSRLDSGYYYGFYASYVEKLTFDRNAINMRTTGSATSTAFNMASYNTAGINVISNNVILNAGGTGINLNSAYSLVSTDRSKLFNNVVGGNFRTANSNAITLSSVFRWDIYHNTFSMNFPTTTDQYSTLYAANCQTLDIRNNHFIYNTTGSGLPLNMSTANQFTTLDYNNYYNLGGGNLLNISGASGSPFSATTFIGGGGVNTGSKNINPGFASLTDLRVSNGCINGVTIAGMGVDLAGNTRNTPPDIGAYEFMGSLSNDVGVSFMSAPASPFVPGTYDVVLRINNYGINAITALDINYTVNGGAPKTISWTGALNPCDTTSIVFTGANQFNFAAGGSYRIKAYTSLPNGSADASNANDTLVTTLCPTLSGAYTINPAGSGSSNFTTLKDAASALSCGGVSGPVTFSISAGIYNEQFAFGSIPGASAINTIEFRPASNTNDVTVRLNSPASNNYLVSLNGADYVKFVKMTFEALSTNYGVAVSIAGGADYNTFDSCVFTDPAGNYTGSNMALVYVNGSRDNYNTFTNNTFNNGAFGVYWNGSSSQYAAGNRFEKNTFNNQYYMGIYTYYMDYMRIRQNVIRANTGYTNYYGINTTFTYNTSGVSEVTKNEITGNVGGGYGMYMIYNNYGNSATNRFLLANNIINLTASTANTLYGINMGYSYSSDFMHNTVQITAQTTATSYAFRNTNFFNTSCFVNNNVFVNSTPGGTNSFAVGEQLSNAGTWNNNNYFSAGTNLAQWGNTGGYPTLAGWRSASSNQDLNSFNMRPVFVSATDLSFKNLPCLNNAGANVLTKVPDDLRGVARTTTPDIGAYEFNSDSLDIAAEAIISPSGAITIGNAYDVSVRIRNAGSNVIKSMNVSYRVNGGPLVTQTLTGITLNPCDVTTVVFNISSGPGAQDQRYIAGGGLNDIKAFGWAPNTRDDLNNSNDTASVILCTPFSGTFTINGSQPLSASNFPTFKSAVDALNGCGGITGPVTFNVAAGTYNEQVVIPAIIGASATNTVTFDGGAGNAASRVLTFGGATNVDRHTLKLNKARYITIRNITIEATGGTYGWGVHLADSAYNNTISNCIINIAGGASTNTGQNFIGVVANNGSNSIQASTGFRMDSVTIDSNTITNGYYGVMFYGITASQSVGTKIRYNTITNAYYYGIHAYFQDAFKINNNKIRMRTGTYGSPNSTGILVSDCNASSFLGEGFHELSGNYITDATSTGIQLQNTNSNTKSQLWNNMIGGGFTYQYGFGLYLSTSSNWNIFHNTINHDASTTNSLYAACYISGGNNNSVKNNIFASTGKGSTGFPFYATTANVPVAGFNYNMFYKPGNTANSQLIYYSGNFTNTTAIGAAGSNMNSIVQDPNFLGVKNLHVKDGCFNGDSLGVLYDIDGNPRASYPDMGADEVATDSNDIGVQFMLKPGVPIAQGLQDVQVIIKNFGLKEVIGGTVSYSVNNDPPVSINFLDTIAPCDTALITFTGAQQYNFVLGNSYELKIFTSLPGGQPDLFNANDTFSTGNICLGMAGNYTIDRNGSGPNNYTNFANAVNALKCGGVAGPVTFDVAADTYNEQVSVPFIPGASSVNTIVFNGGAGNAATRIITYAANTQDDAHTVRFNNTSFVEFHNMTIRGTGSTYAWPVHILGVTNSVKVRNSVIEITASPSTGQNFIPVIMNGSTNSMYTQAKMDSVEIDSNVISNGYTSVWIYNTNGASVKVRNNVMNNAYYYGMYIQSSPAVKILNNTINMSTSGDIASQGMYLVNSSSTGALFNEVSGNKVFDMGQYGFYLASSSGSGAARALMANNMIGGGFRNTTSHAGIQIDNSNYWNIYFNTVNSDIATTGAGAAMSFTNGGLNDVRNNIFAVTAPNSAAIAYAGALGSATQLDYNNYYKAGNSNSLIAIGTSTYGAGNFVGGSGYNSNSFSRDPFFVSSRDLHVGNGCNNGAPIALVTADIDGNPRTTPPDVGADEVTTGFTDNIGVIGILAPTVPVTAGLQDVKLIVANLGNNEVTAATVSYSVNGGAPITMVYTDSIHPCDTALIEFTGFNQYDFVAGGSYTIKAYTSFPNYNNDNNLIDDTITLGPVCTSLRGAYTIDATGSGPNNFTTFVSAANALMCGGVNGHVTFTVADNSYNEQVNIGIIPGIHDTARVTFIGTSQTGTVLGYSASNTLSSHTLRLNNSPYINFYNMTIESKGASVGAAVHILGSSNNVNIKRCIIRAGGSGAGSTSQNLIPVLINNSTDLGNPGANGTGVNNIEIDSNKISGGYYSIYVYGRSVAPVASSIKFRRNTIDSSYYCGAYFAYYIDGVTFNNNEVNMRITGPNNSVGVYFNNCYPAVTSTQAHSVIGNKVINAGQYGMNLYQSYASSSALRSKLVNNMVGGGFRNNTACGITGMYLNYWDILNNSVNLDIATTGPQYSALYIQYGSLQDVRNNLLVYAPATGTGTGLPLNVAQTNVFTALNYNNLYNYVSANVISQGGTVYDSVAFVNQGGFNANSTALLTPFANSKNLHLTTSPSNKGITIASVPSDIDGETRLSPPDIGADEYFSSMDIGVYSIDSPFASAICGGTKNLVIKLKNYGNQTVVNANIDIILDGLLYNTVYWTGNLAGGAISGDINLGPFNFSSGAYSFSISTNSPNSGTDVNANNDTAYKNISVTPSVTPTINLRASQTVLCSGVEVTFIAEYSGGGATPSLQWRKNGLTMPFTGDTLKTTALNDNDSFVVILSTSAACATAPFVISNPVEMDVDQSVPAQIQSFTASATTICDGTRVLFTATHLNGGPNPTYTWYKNGVVQDGDSSTFASTTLQDGDSINVVLQSSLGCANPPRDTSAGIKIRVNPLLVPSATITANTVSFCAGTSVTFAATATNTGLAPVYQWKRNGINVGLNNDTLIINNLNNNDSVSLVLTSNAICATPPIVESNKIPVNVIALVTPSVSITNTTGTICTGSNASFTATPVNGGVNATYNWLVNSVPAGSGSTFNSSSLSHVDTVQLILTADTLCASPQQVSSNKVVMNVKQYVTPDVTITPVAPAVCAGGSVSFTAAPVNGGTTPSYQWLRNGAPVGTDSVKYLGTFTAGDSVAVIVTSNEMCLSRTTDTSSYATVTITPPVTPGVSIVVSADSVCANGTLTFTATPNNGGTTPIYQWKKNGINIGTNAAVQTFGSITNNDSFTVVMTSNAGCAVPATATSNKLGITVLPNVTPSVTIAASSTSICAGGSVTFTATPVNGGTTPSYQWKKNGTNIGANNAIQTFTGINNNDNFTVVLTSNERCVLPATATSAGRQISVTPNVTPSVSINASKTSICLGESVTFNATSTNQGATPTYQWKVNGVNAGTNSSSFTSTSIAGNDSVWVELSSSVTCVTAATVSSNKVKMNANPSVVPSVAVAASTTAACNGTSITFVATPTNGGTNPGFQWKVNGANVSGETNDTFIVSTLGNNDTVTVTLTSNALCAAPLSVTSAKTGISISMPVSPGLTIEASTNTICKGESVTYTATPTNGGSAPVYKWLQNGVEVGTNSPTYTTNTLQPLEDVTCMLTTNLTCVTSSTVLEFGPSVLVKIPPVKPVVTRTGSMLSTVNPSDAYQWFKNDTSISGATTRNYNVLVNGQYSVRVDSNGCSATSDKLNVTDIVGLKEISSIGNISLYPNPAKSSAYLNVQFTTTDQTEISIVDMYGKLVRTIPVGNTNNFEGMIEMSEYADGVYFVLIKHGTDMSQKRLVKAD